MRILVTGGAGFIGSHIVERLLEDGHSVLVVDNLSSGKLENIQSFPGAEFRQLDVGSSAFIEAATAFRPDVISHVAAQPSVAVSMHHPERDAMENIIGGLNVFCAALESQCRQFVYVTTGGALYGEPVYLPCDEDHPIRPASAYGLSKWTLEKYLEILAPTWMRVKVLRLSNVFGPRQNPHGEAGVVSIFTQRMLSGQPVEIFGDGKQIRDFVFVKDVAIAHANALDAEDDVTVNISSQTPLSLNDLFALMATVAEYNEPPVYQPQRPGDLRVSVLSNQRSREKLNWEPVTSFEDGIRMTVDWFKQMKANETLSV